MSFLIVFLILVPSFLLFSEPVYKKVEISASFPIDVQVFQIGYGDAKTQFVQTDFFQFDRLKKKPKHWRNRYFGFLFPEETEFSEFKKKTDLFLFFNLHPKLQERLVLSKLPKEKMILLMFEPPTVLPDMYLKEYHQLFHKIYTWDDDLVDNQLYFKFHYSQAQPMIENPIPFHQKKFCTLVASNLKSDYPHELYSERKKAILFFDENHPNDFEFYGRGWENEQFTTYRGAAGNKIDVIKQYRFSICFENTCTHKGYITEKIFDCFHAGNVPIYWGASNVEEYIPKDCFIDAREFDDWESLYQFVKNINQQTYENYLERIRTFLSSDSAKLFSGEHFKAILSECILTLTES